jgi:dihydrofolate synthase / folylpolyglutamate synthase
VNYQQSVEYIQGFTDYEKTPGAAYTAANYDLRRMEMLLHILGDPHLGTKTVHIAGTKGKGSTAAMISSALSTAGYRTGLYTSPHFHTIRERIRIDNIMISEGEFASLATLLRPAVEKVDGEAAFGRLTTFEILTALMFAYFKKSGVDFQVLEVGLGGRLDATNVITPDVCIITSISLDHTAVLGDTLAKIAAEKAGIIKQGCTVVTFPQTDEAMKVIRETCRKQGAQMIQVGSDVTWNRTSGDLNGQSLTVTTRKQQYAVTIPLIGDFQLENASAAIAALEVLSRQDSRITVPSISEGLRRVQWPGRFHILKRDPLVIADGAHNVYSMQRLIETMRKYANCETSYIIFGASSDKDIKGMSKELAAFSRDITVTTSNHQRAATTGVIAEEFAHLGIHVRQTKTVAEALTQALATTQPNDCILVTGSLFIVGEALTYFQ